MNFIEKYDKPFQYAEILFNLVIALQFYLVWAFPQEHQAQKIIEFATLMAFEFIMVHSGMAMAIVPKKYSLYVLFPAYGLFALILTASIGSYVILITYLFAVFNRMRFAFADVPFSFKIRNGILSIVAVFIYFIGIMTVSALDTRIPELGLTQSFLEKSNYFETAGTTSGMFIELPQTALCLGVGYYITLAFAEFYSTKLEKTTIRIGKFFKPF